jgi:hypothetical protein
MSEHLEHAHWVQNIIHDPRVSFTVRHETFEGTARLIDKIKDSKLVDQVFIIYICQLLVIQIAILLE